MLRPCLGAVVLATALVFASPATAQITCVSCDFNDPADPQGWIAANGPYLTLQPALGVTEGNLRLDTQFPMYIIYLPDAYGGDWSALDGTGSLTLDLHLDPISNVYPEQARVMEIFGPGGSASFDMSTASFGVDFQVWSRITIPINERHWTVTAGTWSALLSDVTSAYLQFYVNGALQAVRIDNVRLGTPGCPQPDFPLSYDGGKLNYSGWYGFIAPEEAFRHPVDGEVYALLKRPVSSGGGLYRVTGHRPGTRVAAIAEPGAALADADGHVFVSQPGDGYVRRVAYPFGEDVVPPIWVSGFNSGDDDPSGMCSAANVAGYEDKILVTDKGNGGACEVWMFDRLTPENEVKIYDETEWSGDPSDMYDITPWEEGANFVATSLDDYYGQIMPTWSVVWIGGGAGSSSRFDHIEILRGVASIPDPTTGGYYSILNASKHTLFIYTCCPLVTGVGLIPLHGVWYDEQSREILLADEINNRIYSFYYQRTVAHVSEEVPSARIAMSVFPNPANPGTRIEFEMPRAATATVAVYNVVGHHVVDLFQGFLSEGRQQLRWNGRIKDGRAAPSGLYFVRLEGVGMKAVAAVTLVR